ncbi:MAG: hypothetical protein P4L53_08020 [Candidatus Obscuribacterales bacterium]|nr:hypothetical protein [Candidatus Obscuribacterales bacterium]
MTTKHKSSMVLAVLMVAQSVPLNVMAFNLSPNSKKSSLSAPVYAKLENSSSSTSSTTQPAPDLSPVKLGDADAQAATSTSAAAAPEQTTEASSVIPAAAEPVAEPSMAPVTTTPAVTAPAEDGGTLNATVEKEGFVPKPPVERTDNVVGEESVVSSKDKSKKQAQAEAHDKAVHEMGAKLGPVELQESDDEMHNKVVTIVDAERAELAEVWDAALCRNQDIQFVVQKLMPTKDPKHSTAVMMKMLSTAMYGAMATSGMAMQSMGTGAYMAQSAGASLVMSVLNSAQSRSARKAAVTETEAIMLYNMIRGVADKVGENFHTYKKGISQVGRACTDYEDLQKMVSDARASQGLDKQIEMEFLLRKARREIDGLNEDARHARESLVNLSGAEAVDILDKQIAIESQKIGQPLVNPEDIPKEDSEKGKVADAPAADMTATDAQEPAEKKKIAEAPKRKKAPAPAKPADDDETNEKTPGSDVEKQSDNPL